MQQAFFRFYDSLNDFLLPRKKNTWLCYVFTNRPAIKDSIEALGVPHTEVAVIVCGGVPVSFQYLLQPEDRIEVYPVHSAHSWPQFYLLSQNVQPPFVFVLDVHLGKLAKTLRLLGFDTVYRNDYDDAALARIAALENRIVLTRDVGLLKQKIISRGYWLRSQMPEEQAAEVMRYFNLWAHVQPFARCLECNTAVVPVQKEAVLRQLPENTKVYYQEFFQCPHCRRVYWKGSHYERMCRFVLRLQQHQRK